MSWWCPWSSAGRTGEAVEHESDHRPLDECLVRLGQPFVVTYEAAPAHEPGEGPLHHPSPRQHREATLVGRLRDDLDGDLPQAPGLLHEPPGIAAVGEHVPQTGEPPVCFLEDRCPAVAILERRTRDHDDEQQPQGVGHDVALAPGDLLAGVVSPAGRAHGVGAANSLRIDDAAAGLGVPRLSGTLRLLAQLVAQSVVDQIEGPVVAPGGEVPVDGPPRRKVFWQHAPGAARASQVQDGVHDLALGVQGRPATGCRGRGLGKQGLDHGPLTIGEVARIPAPRRHMDKSTASTRKSRAPLDLKRAGHARIWKVLLKLPATRARFAPSAAYRPGVSYQTRTESIGLEDVVPVEVVPVVPAVVEPVVEPVVPVVPDPVVPVVPVPDVEDVDPVVPEFVCEPELDVDDVPEELVPLDVGEPTVTVCVVVVPLVVVVVVPLLVVVVVVVLSVVDTGHDTDWAWMITPGPKLQLLALLFGWLLFCWPLAPEA